MRCTQCSADVAAGGRFCPRCGSPVGQPTPLAGQGAMAAGWPNLAASPPAGPAYGGAPPVAGPAYGSSPAGWPAAAYPPAGRGHSASGGGTAAWIIGGTGALVGAALILVACFLPYAHFASCTACTADSPSLLKPGSGQSSQYWYAAEPIGVLLLAIVCGILLFAVRGRLAAVVAAGMLLAFGTQTVLLFAGYRFSFSGSSHAGSAGAIGMLGGVVLISAGLLGLAANARISRAAAS